MRMATAFAGTSLRAAVAAMLAGLVLSHAGIIAGAQTGARTGTVAPAGGDDSLFRAIFFLEGLAADQIPELRRMKSARMLRQIPPAQRTAIGAFQREVLSEIRTSEPAFFGTFDTCMRGGERRAIATCLNDAGTMVDRVIDRSPKLTKSRQDIRAAWVPESGDRAGGTARAPGAIVVMWPPLTYQWPNVVLTSAKDGGGALLREELVNSIAATLKGSR